DWSPNSRFAGMHRAQLSHLAEIINAAHKPLLVSGDFNTAADSVFFREFRSQTDLVDAFEGQERPTFRSEFLPADRSAHRIDYIFTGGRSLKVTGALLVLDGQLALSDHYGLRATAEWGEP
ncbi:MAG: endonuclease/exonuclease/phosphatase family protein, partial [Mycobacteriales bacterium]